MTKKCHKCEIKIYLHAWRFELGISIVKQSFKLYYNILYLFIKYNIIYTIQAKCHIFNLITFYVWYENNLKHLIGRREHNILICFMNRATKLLKWEIKVIMIVMSSVGCRLLIVLRGTTTIISKSNGFGCIPPAANVIIDIIF
jgi:hypothetical protein